MAGRHATPGKTARFARILEEMPNFPFCPGRSMSRREFGALLAAAPGVASQWTKIAAGTDGTVGAMAMHLGSHRSMSINADERFPLASVCKLPLAMHMAALVDEKRLALDQMIDVHPDEVWPGVSPIAERWPRERRFPLGEMIRLMVAKSDNTAVETLYRLGGGAEPLRARFAQWGIDGIRIDRSERQCMRDLESPQFLHDPRDTGTPVATVRLLARLFHGDLLSKPSTALMIDALKATTTFPTRIKGRLPAGTVVAHKTGSSFTGKLAIATNDSGVIYLPDGGLVAISVYVKASTRDAATRDRVIAQLARSAYDAMLGQPSTIAPGRV